MPATAMKFATLMWWPILIFLLVATSVIGTLAGIFALIATTFALPVLFTPGAVKEVRKQPMLLLFALGFVLFAFFSALSATSPAHMQYVANFLPFILAIPLYVLATKQKGKKVTLLILSLCLGGALIALLIALYQTQILGLARADSYFSGAIVFARNTTVLGVLAAMGFVIAKGPIRYIFLLGPIIATGTILLAQSRGTIIAIPVLLVMLTIFLLRRIPAGRIKIFLVIGLIVVFIGLIAAIASLGTGRISALVSIIPQLLESGNSADASVNIRLDFYRTGIDLFPRSPWIGHGWAQMGDIVYTILNPANYTPLLVEKFHFHNDILNFAVAGGVLGIITYFTFLLAPLLGAIHTQKDNFYRLRLELISLLTVLYFISGLTDMVISYDLPTTMFALLSALILGAVRAD